LSEERPERAPWVRARAPELALGALVLAILSLGLNVYLLWRLRGAQDVALQAAVRVADRLAAQDATLRYRIRLPAGTPLRLDIPIDERLTVNLNTTLPINTDVRVPLRGPFGTYNVTVPIHTVLPIHTVMPLHVTDTFRLRTQTKDELVVPLEVRVRDLPLDALRESLRK